MDFGLAKPLEELGTSQRGIVVGTPRYMAPEQMRGQLVDTHADYFSLGCVAVEMLTGEPLFAKGSFASMMIKLETFRPKKIQDLCPDISSELCDLLMTWLAHDPENREFDRAAVQDWAAPVEFPPDVPFSESETQYGLDETELS